MMQISLDHTEVFSNLWPIVRDQTHRFISLQGGARSSKTTSLCQAAILYCLINPNKIVSIVRKTMPSLRSSAMRDFVDQLRLLGLYEQRRHNKSENIYTFPNGSQVEFFSVDDEQKVRGRKRHICWVNECNEIWNQDFLQLNLRTEEQMWFDYNPSFQTGYIYEVNKRPNAIMQKSTFRMNPFLTAAQVEELEFLKYTDPDSYTVYNLGERASSSEHVIRHYQVQQRPDDLTQYAYGLDFGWTHPNALVKVWHDGTGRRFHLEEITGRPSQSIDDLIEVIKVECSREDYILADEARPDLINTIQEAGFNCFGADKAVKKGLEILRTSVLTVEPSSSQLISNLQSYRYKKVRGILTEEVMKQDDDFVDATRYCTTFIRSISGGLTFSSMEM